MIKVVVKAPAEAPEVKELAGTADFAGILEGEFEIVSDDELAGISLVVEEDARGVKANNFPITSDGFLDWVYGTCIFVREDGQSLTEEDVQTIMDYLAKKK
jgi:hypothetical protein